MDTVSDRIKYIRTNAKGKKLTLEEFGDSLGISKAAAFNLENPSRLPSGVSDSTIKLICSVYHVNYRWLTEGKEPIFLAMDADSLVDRYAPDESEYFRAAARGMMGLSDEAWIKLRDFVDMLREAERTGKEPTQEP